MGCCYNLEDLKAIGKKEYYIDVVRDVKPPVAPADGEEAKTADEAPKDEAADDKPKDQAADDALDKAKDLTMGQKAYNYVYGAPEEDPKGEEAGEPIGERIKNDPLELEILETPLPN